MNAIFVKDRVILKTGVNVNDILAICRKDTKYYEAVYSN